MKDEIYEIPYRAELCYQKNKGLILPEMVPYIGMGSSYLATLAFNYLGIKIFPVLASDYYHYLQPIYKNDNGVLISQSGQSSETLKCATSFKTFTSIVNESESPLGSFNNCVKTVNIHAGPEQLLPTKTFINTLLVLYMGFGFNPGQIITLLKTATFEMEKTGIDLAKLIYKHIRKKGIKGIFTISSGPNIAAAHHAALVLSEITRIPVFSLQVSQFDHGFKEASKNALIIALNHNQGAENLQTADLLSKIKRAGASVFEINQSFTDEKFGPLIYPMYFFFAAEFLSRKLKIINLFEIGKKITKTIF